MRRELAYCDFLIVAPLELEVKAIDEALVRLGWSLQEIPSFDIPQSEFGYVREFMRVDRAVGWNRRTTVVVRLRDQGVLAASCDTALLLEYLYPGHVISFGIAGSMDEKDAPIGTVVYATNLFYYEPSKDEDGRVKSATSTVPISRELEAFTAAENVIVVKQPIASGEKLFNDLSSIDFIRIKEMNRKIIAVEMEAAGIGAALQRLCPSSIFAAVKGISDLASDKEAKQDQPLAAQNAAACLAELVTTAPLRRGLNNQKPHETKQNAQASRETDEISDALERWQVTVEKQQLYRCLFARPGPVPAYFHWTQTDADLHWIDFKILSALGRLPKKIVTPVPIANVSNALANKAWKTVAAQLSGANDVFTNKDRVESYDEINLYITNLGVSPSEKDKLKEAIDRAAEVGGTGVAFNTFAFMLGQLCHRRFLVVMWERHAKGWLNLPPIAGTSFALLKLQTLKLGGKLGKHEPPGSDLFIDPPSFERVRAWARKSTPSLVGEFVSHFSNIPGWNVDASKEANDQLEELLAKWTIKLAV